jgi:hypothetical protein
MSNSTRQSPLRLSRILGDRLLLGVLALTVAILSGWGCWVAFFQSKRPIGVLDAITQFVIHDAILAVFILCLLALVWAVAAPRWLERLIERRVVAAYFAVLLAVPVVFIYLWLR